MDRIITHWVIHNGQVSVCSIRRGEAWLAEQGKIAADRYHSLMRMEV